MFGFRLLVPFTVLLAVCYQHTSALTDEERGRMFAEVLPHLTECSAQFSVSPDQIMSDGKAGKLDSCLVKCILKKVQLINGQGMFDPAKALELSRGKFSSPDDQKTVEEIINKCTSVNSQAVSDGAEGCDRTRLLMECARPYRGQFFPGL